MQTKSEKASKVDKGTVHASGLRMGVVGYGYWGPNIVRNFSTVDGATVVAVSDLRDDSLKKVEKNHRGVRTTKNADELIRAADIDAVAIVTPVFTHFELAKKALEAGKHVFVEKPFTYTVAQAEELIDLAEQEEPQDHGGPHLPLHGGRPQDEAAHRRRHAGQDLTTTTPCGSTWACSSTT